MAPKSLQEQALDTTESRPVGRLHLGGVAEQKRVGPGIRRWKNFGLRVGIIQKTRSERPEAEIRCNLDIKQTVAREQTQTRHS